MRQGATAGRACCWGCRAAGRPDAVGASSSSSTIFAYVLIKSGRERFSRARLLVACLNSPRVECFRQPLVYAHSGTAGDLGWPLTRLAACARYTLHACLVSESSGTLARGTQSQNGISPLSGFAHPRSSFDCRRIEVLEERGVQDTGSARLSTFVGKAALFALHLPRHWQPRPEALPTRSADELSACAALFVRVLPCPPVLVGTVPPQRTRTPSSPAFTRSRTQHSSLDAAQRQSAASIRALGSGLRADGRLCALLRQTKH